MATPSPAPWRGRPRPKPHCIYVNCFGSHPCGSSIFYEGHGSWRLQRHEAGRGPWGAEAKREAEGSPGSPELASAKTGRPLASSPGTLAPRVWRSPRSPGQARGSRMGRAPMVGTEPENVSDVLEVYIPLNEAAKVTKKKKKYAAWDSVYKVISKMLDENEKIRDRMNFKQGCAKSGDLIQSKEKESSHLSG
ncbi:uncharacterized protein C5orf47 homolog [Dromiciops gliroides]|uniref:uncharacterized protein C5orf47 homolog n=1 Tax=Dromiciops gliroides TaxID=33562 RepID=UPI001CC43AD9|nr:uncharacterized protein C5orf47 homolog [Dromiciops gliroides]